MPRVLTTAGAERLDISVGQVRTEVRRGRWQRLAAGVLLTRPEEPTRTDWIQAGLALCDDHGVVSGWDAVRLVGIGPRRPPGERVLILTASGRHRTVGGVRLRPSRRALRYSDLGGHPTLPGIRIARPARAVADTALDMSDAAAVRAMVTGCVQRRLCTPVELLAEYQAGPRNGSGLLRLGLEDAVLGARSLAEARRRIGGFTANAPILDAHGNVVACADLLWDELRAIVEIDSREYHFSEADWHKTERRHNRLERLDYSVLHYAPSEIMRRGTDWADEIADWLDVRRRTRPDLVAGRGAKIA